MHIEQGTMKSSAVSDVNDADWGTAVEVLVAEQDTS
jgi:hypothetical protein